MNNKSKVKQLSKHQISKPLVSVIVCAYQHVKFISRCLDGILMQQTDFNFEIILGEDESTDGTREICIEYANKNPKIIKLFLRKRKDVLFVNGRPTGRYNFLKSYEACRGQYIAICDGDDAWRDVKKLQKQVDHLMTNQKDVISCHNALVCDEDGVILKSSLLAVNNQKNFSRVELICGKHLSLSSVLFRNVLGELPRELQLILNADTFIFMLLGFHGNAKYQGDIEKNIYTTHASSLWSSRNFYQQQVDKNLLYKTMYMFCYKMGNKKGAKCLINKYLGTNRNLIIMNLNQNRKVKSMQYMTEALIICLNYFYFKLGLKQLNYFLKHLIRLS